MATESNTSLAETAQVEQAALALVKNDIDSAEKPLSTPNITKVTRKEVRPQYDRKAAMRARREMYADKTVPRIRSERRFGGSSHSRAYLKQALCLYSDRAQIFFENNYERVNMSLIVSTLVIEAIGGTDLAEQISLRIEKEFRDLETQMMNSYNELQRIATAKKIPSELQVPAYDHKRFYEPPLHTPHSVHFMTVVQLFDRIIARAEGCWINHVMNAQTRNKIVRSWEKKLIAFVRDLHEIRLQAVAQAKKTGYGQRAAAIEADIRRQQSQEQLEKTDLPTNGEADKPDAPVAAVKEKQEAKQEAESAPSSSQTEAEPKAVESAQDSVVEEAPAEAPSAPEPAQA